MWVFKPRDSAFEHACAVHSTPITQSMPTRVAISTCGGHTEIQRNLLPQWQPRMHTLGERGPFGPSYTKLSRAKLMTEERAEWFPSVLLQHDTAELMRAQPRFQQQTTFVQRGRVSGHRVQLARRREDEVSPPDNMAVALLDLPENRVDRTAHIVPQLGEALRHPVHIPVCACLMRLSSGPVHLHKALRVSRSVLPMRACSITYRWARNPTYRHKRPHSVCSPSSDAPFGSVTTASVSSPRNWWQDMDTSWELHV